MPDQPHARHPTTPAGRESLSGMLMLPEGDNAVRLSPGTVTIEGGRIADVFEHAGVPTDLVIAPGFIDAHLHLPQFDSIGAQGLELLDWLERIIFPAEARWQDARFAWGMAERVAAQLHGFGTTAVAAYATVHHEGTQAAIDALGDAGFAGHIGQVLMDQGAPAFLLRPAGQLLREAAQLRGRGRIAPAVTPRFAVSCSRELLDGAGRLARETGWLVQTHLSETRREIEAVRKLHGAEYVEVYRRAGLVTSRTVFGHGIWLDESDHAALARARAVIAHCPTANRFLEAGAMERALAASRGVRVALGSDVAGGPDRSMVRVARAMIETARQLGRPAPTAAQCWGQITRGNAEALGLEAATGAIAPGLSADLVVFRPDVPVPWQAAPVDPLSMLIFAWDDRWISRVLATGSTVYQRATA